MRSHIFAQYNGITQQKKANFQHNKNKMKK